MFASAFMSLSICQLLHYKQQVSTSTRIKVQKSLSYNEWDDVFENLEEQNIEK